MKRGHKDGNSSRTTIPEVGDTAFAAGYITRFIED